MATKSEKPRAPRKRKPAPAKPREWTDEQKQQIAERAYKLFLERGGEHGYQLEDWLRAEKEFAAGLASAKPRRTARASRAGA